MRTPARARRRRAIITVSTQGAPRRPLDQAVLTTQGTTHHRGTSPRPSAARGHGRRVTYWTAGNQAPKEARCSNEFVEHLEHLGETKDLSEHLEHLARPFPHQRRSRIYLRA